MSRRLYKIKLKKAEKKQLENYVKQGQRSARAIVRARILLLANEGKTVEEIVKRLDTSRPTVYRIRQRYVDEGLEFILKEKPRSGQPSKIDSRLEAQLVTIACSEPPKGSNRWTLRLLADKLIELELTESISHTHVATLLKKMSLSLG
jgi:transposase